jgi:hypothetical protein
MPCVRNWKEEKMMNLLKRSKGKNRNKRERNVLMWNNRHTGHTINILAIHPW